MAEISPTLFSFPENTDFHQPIICTGESGARINLDSATALILTVYPRPREGATASFVGIISNCITEIDYTEGELMLNFEPADLVAGEYQAVLSCTLAGAPGDDIQLGWVEIKVTRGIA